MKPDRLVVALLLFTGSVSFGQPPETPPHLNP